MTLTEHILTTVALLFAGLAFVLWLALTDAADLTRRQYARIVELEAKLADTPDPERDDAVMRLERGY